MLVQHNRVQLVNHGNSVGTIRVSGKEKIDLVVFSIIPAINFWGESF